MINKYTCFTRVKLFIVFRNLLMTSNEDGATLIFQPNKISVMPSIQYMFNDNRIYINIWLEFNHSCYKRQKRRYNVRYSNILYAF